MRLHLVLVLSLAAYLVIATTVAGSLTGLPPFGR
jgi:hypothetical protein